MIYNFCITCEHYNDRNRFPEACYGCYNGRNYEVNHYYDMTKEDIEKMIKNEEDDAMTNETNYESKVKLDIVESDIIDELLALAKKNNDMLIDIQKRLDEIEGLIWPWPKHLSEEDDVFDEKKTVEDIILDQEKEDKYVEDFRSFTETRDRILESINGVQKNTIIDAFANCYANKSDPLNSKIPRYEIKYRCDKCKHGYKMLYEEPCNSCIMPNDKFEPMSSIDKMKHTITDAFANCAKAVKDFDKRFNETEGEE